MKNILIAFLLSILLIGCISKKEHALLNEKYLILKKEYEKLNTELKKERLIAVESSNLALKSSEICKQKNIYLANRIKSLEEELKIKSDSLYLLSK